MLKMGLMTICLFFFCFLGLTGAGQESIEYLKLYETSAEVIHALSHDDLPIAVHVNGNVLREVSSSVLKAESWLRVHVLAHFPATKITTILVGETFLCQIDEEESLGFYLPSIKNIYHSLTRWGLEKDIKVSTAFSSKCLMQNSALFSDGLAKNVIKSMLEFFQNTNSTYSIIVPPNLSSSLILLYSHLDFMKKFGSLMLTKVNVVVCGQKVKSSISRKLSAFPARPTPSPETTANVAKKPHPPQFPTVSPPPFSFPVDSPPLFSFAVAPELPSPFVPASSPTGFHLPPCNPAYDDTAPAPQTEMMQQKLWCVAKPSVPSDTLQEAMDYACGEGGADCKELMTNENCFYPDTMVAHASYAFNSYWQKTKRDGGTCNFGGTAMIINADPTKHSCHVVPYYYRTIKWPAPGHVLNVIDSLATTNNMTWLASPWPTHCTVSRGLAASPPLFTHLFMDRWTTQEISR
ncbi:zinc finger protein ZAT10-like [Hibiscus syriacus]|uniref:glucan endo-1,3-beta-D-glucosidase n=1 Tax=Hibiscus syriacus TaxID=106335 RepID=A0A6A3APQ5_HIBSY|nr:zinc finger protein ZAT10-like [Hibiscus syriacus]